MQREPHDPLATRRGPTQRRAEVLVGAIRQAAREILEREGPDGLTTNRVAERAGVSIGSLYHYYPNKETIVADVFEQLAADYEKQVEESRRGVDFAELPPEIAFQKFLEMGVRQRLRFARLHKAFFRDWSHRFTLSQRKAPDGRSYDEVTRAWVKALLERHRAELGVSDLDVAARFVVWIAEGLLRAATEHDLPQVSEEEICRELARAILGYLRYAPADPV